MAEKPAVHPDMAVGEALRGIARDVLSEAHGVLANLEKPNAVAVHDYRKAMKRWRALLRLLQPFLGDEGQHLRIEARDFARELAGARDAHAAIEALEDLAESEPPLSPRTISSIRGRLDEIRLNAEAATLTQAVRARLTIGLENTASTIDGWPVDQITFAHLARELTKTYRRVRKDAPEDWPAAEPEVADGFRLGLS